MKNEYSIRETGQGEQVLYDRLLEGVRTQSPEELIEDFRYLFIEGIAYKDYKVRLALEKIVTSNRADKEFNFILNRCCHILINHWQLQPQSQAAIPKLLDAFDRLLPVETAHSRTARRLRQLVKNFTQTEQFLTLQRLARIISEKEKESNSVGNLIKRYPYLYEHCLLSDDSSSEAQQTVRKIQTQIQHRFEIDLSRYVTYQVRIGEMMRTGQLSEKKMRLIQPVNNPTLLTERELGSALKQFIGKVENGYTYRELSQSFISYTAQASSYKIFKDNLYEYLILSVDPKYGKHQFNDKLYKKLQETLCDFNSQQPSEFLILRTCSQLLNFLIVESSSRPNHYIFVDTITNLGPTRTVGLLLKIVLLCRKVKPYLEKRFSILFSHYESFNKEGVPWLIKSMENLHIAFSVYFGKIDLSCLKQIM